MRSFISGLAVLVAIVAIALAVPSWWMKERVISADGFSSIAKTVAADPAVQSYMADEIVAQVGEATNGVAGAGLIRPFATAYTTSPQFQADFVDVASQEHAWLFNPATPETQGKPMQLDLTGMVNRVIASAHIPVKVPGPITVPISRRSDGGLDAGRYSQVSSQITQIAQVSAIVAVIAALLALITARRRGTVLAWLGLGTIVAAAISWGLAALMAARAKQEVASTADGARRVAEITIDYAVTDMSHVALIVGGVGLAMVVVGALIRAFGA